MKKKIYEDENTRVFIESLEKLSPENLQIVEEAVILLLKLQKHGIKVIEKPLKKSHGYFNRMDNQIILSDRLEGGQIHAALVRACAQAGISA